MKICLTEDRHSTGWTERKATKSMWSTCRLIIMLGDKLANISVCPQSHIKTGLNMRSLLFAEWSSLTTKYEVRRITNYSNSISATFHVGKRKCGRINTKLHLLFQI